MLLINCSHCRRQLQLPPAASSIRCTICGAITFVSAPQPSFAGHGQQFLSPPPPLPRVHGSKRAVICGISYKNTPNELQGCINDAKCMKYMLANRFNFPESSIIMLTDEETDFYRRPTKQNIRMALQWLVQNVQPGDSLLFHFSGHGLQSRNYTGDEIDGFDETLCPLDFETEGTIVDDEINATIVRPLPYGAKLHAMVDSCHSGTMLDLPFLCRMNNRDGRYAWEDHRPPSGVYKGTNGGEVISFSGCDDDQSSADTQALSKVTTTGAMTFSFIKAIESRQAATYGEILKSMRETIRDNDINQGGHLVTNIITMLLSGGSLSGRLKQEPQLTAHAPFDVYRKPFSI